MRKHDGPRKEQWGRSGCDGEGACERVTRVGGRERSDVKTETDENNESGRETVEEGEGWKGKQNSEEVAGRGGEGRAYITVKNARGTSAVYTSSTIDRLQRGGGRVAAMALLMLAEAGHRAILSAIETGAS